MMEQVCSKQITIEVPYNKELYDFTDFSPEENYVILKTGVESLKMSKKLIRNSTHATIYESVYSEFLSKMEASKEEIDKKSLELLVEKEIMTKYKEEELDRVQIEIDKMIKYKMDSYETLRIEKDKDIQNLSDSLFSREKELIKLKEEIRMKELEISNIIDKEVNEKVKIERDKQNEAIGDVLTKNKALLENISQNSGTKTSTEIGLIGEKIFGEIAETTFQDFDGFELVDVHKQTHKGDWHINIKELTIMVDAKSYKRKVDITQREKIKNDLKQNQHIHFAWLVSLNTKIDKQDNGIFIFEWISEKQCIVYINNLLSIEDPHSILKTIYFLCKENYNRIVNSKLDTIEITRMREHHHMLNDKITLLKKRVKEIKVSINGLRNLHDNLETDIVNLLNTDSNNFMNKYYDVIVKWWDKNLEEKEGSKIKSTIIWNRFKKENEELVKELDVNTFKEIICAFISENNIIKSKNKSGALEINNIDWIEEEIVIETEK
jgi:hypothetical protein